MKIKVLVPIDLSERSDTALACIAMLARREQLDVCLLHCFDDLLITGPEPMGSDISASQIQTEQVLHRNENDAKEKLEKVEIELTKMLASDATGNCTVHKEFVWGRQDDKILEFADEYEPDLILNVRRGDVSWFDRFFGSVSSELVGDSTFPVLSLTSESGLQNLDHILFASDFKTGDTKAIRQVQNIFAPFDPKITCIHVRQKVDHETDEATRHRLGEMGIQVEMVDGEELVGALSDAMKRHGASMLAVNTRLRGHFQQFFEKGVTGQLLEDTSLPILSLHAETKE